MIIKTDLGWMIKGYRGLYGSRKAALQTLATINRRR